MSECLLGSIDLIFNPEPEVVNQPIDSRRSQVVKIGKRCLTGDVASPKVCITEASEDCSVIDTHISSEATTDDPESNKGFVRRAAAITEMADTFADHDYVLDVIAKHRSKKTTAYSSDLKIFIKNSAGLFNILSKQETDEYFKHIDSGVELYESGIDLANLSPDDEKTVLDLVAARQVLMLTNLRFVMSISSPFKNPSVDDADLIEEGIIGLSKAVDRFDRSKKYQFLTYAHKWIFQGVMRAINRQSRVIKIPMHVHEEYRKVTVQINNLQLSLGRDATNEETQQATGLTSNEISELMMHGSYNLPSIDARFNDENDGTLADVYGALDQNIEKVVDTMHNSKLLDKIINAANLDNRRLFVLGLYYGIDLSSYGDFEITRRDGTVVSYDQAKTQLDQYAEIKQQDIGDIMGVSRQYIRHLEVSALQKLREVSSFDEYRGL